MLCCRGGIQRNRVHRRGQLLGAAHPRRQRRLGRAPVRLAFQHNFGRRDHQLTVDAQGRALGGPRERVAADGGGRAHGHRTALGQPRQPCREVQYHWVRLPAFASTHLQKPKARMQWAFSLQPHQHSESVCGGGPTDSRSVPCWRIVPDAHRKGCFLLWFISGKRADIIINIIRKALPQSTSANK